MRRLILLRHAQAQSGGAGLADFDRPLTEAGEQCLPRVAQRLRERDALPQRILSSSAVRALDTAHLLALALNLGPGSVRAEGRLYLASAGDLLACVNALDDGAELVMLVAHNPGLALLAALLSQGEIRDLPTAAALGFRFDAPSWAQAGPHNARFWFQIAP